MSDLTCLLSDGVEIQEKYLQVLLHDLNNAYTPGFKSSDLKTQDLHYEDFPSVVKDVNERDNGITVSNGCQIGNGARLATVSRDNGQGPIERTNNDLDFALDGKGYFQIKLPDGSLGYTRNGRFHFEDGRLLTSEGYEVVCRDFNITPQNAVLNMVMDRATGRLMGGVNQADVLVEFNICQFQNESNLDASYGSSIMRETELSGAPEEVNVGTLYGSDATILQNQSLESSNVDVYKAFIQMEKIKMLKKVFMSLSKEINSMNSFA